MSVAKDYTLPLNPHFKAKLVQFCDAVSVLEMNLYVKLLHPNIQLEDGWTPFGVQPCCDRARSAALKRLTCITLACAIATWSNARVQFRTLGNFVRLSLVNRQWYKALESARASFKQMELDQREVLLDQTLTAGAMSSVSFGKELELPAFSTQHGHMSNTHGVYPDGVSGYSQ